ncbi:MAG TPA: MarR family transcriptional regulator [Candidatus Mediterraneibacter vanvlietii]|nr:MarR family transcriptional regulator [Candidatus Mediterraneibacter vanvlietii]
MTGAIGNILDYIIVESEKRSVYQKEIEGEFGLRPSTATEALKHLEKEGLIVRVPDESDARFKKIEFTEKAGKIKDLLRNEVDKSEEILLRGISPEEQKCFMEITAKMLENLEEEER